MIPEFESCYRAVHSKDARFDGWFYTAVTSTGVYCRPSCPARTPMAKNVRFYPSAAAAQQAGFRACKRCRPDAAPGSPEWDMRADLVARAMRLIADGIVDRAGVGGLASALGYSTRQLERLLISELGAGPIALARAQRAQTARVLIESSSLPMTDVAFAAGFASVRQFNDVVRAVFASSPSQLRRRAAGRAVGGQGRAAAGQGGTAISLRLPFRQPLSGDNLFGHLAATSVPGVEEVRNGWYRRTLRLTHAPGIAELRALPHHVACRLILGDLRDLTSAVARCRRLLDLDADPEAVCQALSSDRLLAPLLSKAPGGRVPRTVDEAELALRAVASQQVGAPSARSQLGRLARAHGQEVADPNGGLTHLFPDPTALADSEATAFRGPAARRATIVALANELAAGRLDVGPGCDRERVRAQLHEIPGIGPWSVEMVAMRALGDPDAFPAGDSGVRRAAAMLDLPGDPRSLSARADRWRPWRAYATVYLWSYLDNRPT